MKIAYIAHPVGGAVKKNLAKIAKIARRINLTEPGTVPFVPYFIDVHAMDDNNMDERARGFENNKTLLRKGFIDEIRLYGDRISTGMFQEILWAEEMGIPVIPKSIGTKIAWDNLQKEARSPLTIQL